MLKKFSINKIICFCILCLYVTAMSWLCRCNGITEIDRGKDNKTIIDNNTIIEHYYMELPINSDKANHLLEAKDILNGNVFLKDWNLTGILFLTTDLIYYEIAEFLFGISFKSVYFACGLMIASVMIMAYFTACTGVNNDLKFKRILLFLLLAIPCQTLKAEFYHTGAVFLSLCIFILYYLIIEEEKANTWYLVLLSLAVFMGTFGDLLTAAIGSIPIILFSLYKLLSEKTSAKKYIAVIVSILFSTLIALIGQKVYIQIGGANPNSFMGNQIFSSVSEWGNKIHLFINDLMSLSMADFSGNPIFDIWNIIKGVYFLLLIIEIIFMIIIIVKIIKGNKVDTISALLTLSCLISFLAYVLTSIANLRYMTIIPIAGVIILIRNIDWIINKFYRQIAVKSILIFLVCIGLIGKIHELSQYKIWDIKADTQQMNQQLLVLDFLEKKKLTNGYASYWDASSLTVLSHDKIKIRAIENYKNTIRRHNWFCKSQWYAEPADFVLINNDYVYGDISEKNVIKFWGKPTEIHEIADYKILVYDQCLSDSLGKRKIAIEDGIISSDEMSITGSAEVLNEKIYLAKEGIVYGPYDPINAGEYTITYTGNNLENAVFDIYSEKNKDNGINSFYYAEENRTNERIVVKLQINKAIDDIEFRLINPTNITVELDKIVVESINDF